MAGHSVKWVWRFSCYWMWSLWCPSGKFSVALITCRTKRFLAQCNICEVWEWNLYSTISAFMGFIFETLKFLSLPFKDAINLCQTALTFFFFTYPCSMITGHNHSHRFAVLFSIFFCSWKSLPFSFPFIQFLASKTSAQIQQNSLIWYLAISTQMRFSSYQTVFTKVLYLWGRAEPESLGGEEGLHTTALQPCVFCLPQTLSENHSPAETMAWSTPLRTCCLT